MLTFVTQQRLTDRVASRRADADAQRQAATGRTRGRPGRALLLRGRGAAMVPGLRGC